MLNKDSKWTGRHEPHTPGFGPANITFNYVKETSALNAGVSITSPGQTISNERLLEAAAFLIHAYCTANNIPCSEIIIIKNPL